MNGPAYTLKMGLEPGLQLIIVVSAIMHILAIVLINDPFDAKEKIEDRYFVKLVMTSGTDQTQKPASMSKSFIKEKTVVNIKPAIRKPSVNKQVKAESPAVIPVPIEKKSITTEYGDIKQSLKSIIPLAKSRSSSVSTGSIRRNVQGSREVNSGDDITIDRTARGPEFAAKTDFNEQGEVITEKSVSVKPAYKPVSKGVREQSFADTEDEHNEQYMIEQNMMELEKENVTVEKVPRDSLFAASGEREEMYEKHYEISRTENAGKNDPVHEYSEENTSAYPETDFSSSPGIPSIIGNENIPAISIPAGPDMHVIKKVSRHSPTEQLITNTGSDEKQAADQQLSDMSIKGVHLGELNACSNALDERTLKKKILNIVGNKKGCSSQDVGEYLFIGTERFASFDMKILPGPGRKLSNRCEELRNAFHCLTMK